MLYIMMYIKVVPRIDDIMTGTRFTTYTGNMHCMPCGCTRGGTWPKTYNVCSQCQFPNLVPQSSLDFH